MGWFSKKKVDQVVEPVVYRDVVAPSDWRGITMEYPVWQVTEEHANTFKKLSGLVSVTLRRAPDFEGKPVVEAVSDSGPVGFFSVEDSESFAAMLEVALGDIVLTGRRKPSDGLFMCKAAPDYALADWAVLPVRL